VLKNEFFDVYWTEDDLTREEQEAWKKRNLALVMDFGSDEKKEELLNFKVKCPICSGESCAREYQGDFYLAICPKCGGQFQPTLEQLCKSLYFCSIH